MILLVAFSDGLSEATNAADEEFGSARVLDAIAAHFDRPTDQVMAKVLEFGQSLLRERAPSGRSLPAVVRARPAFAGS